MGALSSLPLMPFQECSYWEMDTIIKLLGAAHRHCWCQRTAVVANCRQSVQKLEEESCAVTFLVGIATLNITGNPSKQVRDLIKVSTTGDAAFCLVSTRELRNLSLASHQYLDSGNAAFCQYDLRNRGSQCHISSMHLRETNIPTLGIAAAYLINVSTRESRHDLVSHQRFNSGNTVFCPVDAPIWDGSILLLSTVDQHGNQVVLPSLSAHRLGKHNSVSCQHSSPRNPHHHWNRCGLGILSTH